MPEQPFLRETYTGELRWLLLSDNQSALQAQVAVEELDEHGYTAAKHYEWRAVPTVSEE